ncbi:MAG: aldo/keto reductase [Bryobacteraceae bacterium]|jgi:predicted aldo/keto reductase-like oxidoreductase
MQSTRRGFLAGTALLLGPRSLKAAPGEMPKRKLGKTGLEPTVLGFGCMTTTDASVIEQAAEAGVNWFDTARGYQNGNNERMVGAALKSRRQKVHITTKTPARNKADALAHLDTSLRELQTDYVDVWYLHNRSNPSDCPDELFDAQDEAVKAGKARFRGVSFHANHEQMFRFLIDKGRTDVILVSYNFAMGEKIEPLMKEASDKGIGIVAMKVMAGGYRRLREGDPMREKMARPGAFAAALKWAVRRPFVHTAIPGILDLDQLDENWRAVVAGWQPETDGKLLAAQLEMIRPVYCRSCGACTGACTKGLPVSDMIRYVTYADGYGEFALGRDQFRLLPERVREARCSDCAVCAVRCPNGVQVRRQVARAQELFA